MSRRTTTVMSTEDVVKLTLYFNELMSHEPDGAAYFRSENECLAACRQVTGKPNVPNSQNIKSFCKSAHVDIGKLWVDREKKKRGGGGGQGWLQIVYGRMDELERRQTLLKAQVNALMDAVMPDEDGKVEIDAEQLLERLQRALADYDAKENGHVNAESRELFLHAMARD